VNPDTQRRGPSPREFANTLRSTSPQPDGEAEPASASSLTRRTSKAIIDVAFWASLRREEGVTPTISLALLPPTSGGQAITFAADLPLRASALAKVGPAVERPGIHLGVWRRDGELRVWGTTRMIPAFCMVVEVVASGLLVIKHRNDPFGKFVNVAVLEGDQVKVVDEGTSMDPDCPGPIKSLLGIEVLGREPGQVDVLVQLSASMRAHRRGGALLVVPSDDPSWSESIIGPVLYGVDPPFAELADLMRREKAEADSHEWQEDLRRSIGAIAGLTAVDGATIITDRYELMAFGAKITRRRGRQTVERVLVTEPVEGSQSAFVAPAQFGGTRHLSAAQFVHDQRGCDRARRLPGRKVHDLQVVHDRKPRARAPGGSATDLKNRLSLHTEAQRTHGGAE
jgi:hypothetical protein